MVFFFFQAEDGIRDVAVTGVQTCALPISQEVGVAARLHHFAAAGPALELADDTDLVQPEVRRDQQPHEREEHDGLPPDHLRVRVRLSMRAWKASDVACPSNRLPFTKKLGVPWTPARSFPVPTTCSRSPGLCTAGSEAQKGLSKSECSMPPTRAASDPSV